MLTIDKKYWSKIGSIDINAGSPVLKAGQWKGILKGANEVRLIELLNKPVTRKLIIHSFKKESFEVAVALTMIWGYANPGYGPYRVKRLITRENLEKFTKAYEEVKRDPHQAFAILKEINGLGISYISKFLYFSSKAQRVKSYSLIFDTRAAQALVQLNIDPSITQMISIQPKSTFEAYRKYCQELHRLASQYKVEADQIELFLFEQNFE